MFVTIKDVTGASHTWPINLVNLFHKDNENYYARVQYNTLRHDNIPIGINEYNRLKKIKDQEDVLMVDMTRKTAIQQLEA